MVFKGKKVVKAQKGPSKTFAKKANFKSKTVIEKHPLKSFDSDTSSDSDTDESESSSSSGSDSEVEIKFELFNMAESDYHSVKQYLTNSFGAGEHGVDLVGLTSFLVEGLADHVGTCIKTAGEASDPFGFISGFPISFATQNHPNICPFLSSFESFITLKCEKLLPIEFFSKKGNNVILFQERLINVPGSISVPLYRQFLDDWRMAAREEPAHFAKPQDVLLITPTYKEIVSQLDRELGLKEIPSKFDCASSMTCFYYEEVEFLEKFATKFIDFSVNTGHETSDSRRAFSENGIEPGRRAHLLSWDNFVKYVEYLETEIIN